MVKLKWWNLHRKATEKLLELLIGGRVGEVANVKSASLGSRSSVGSISLGGVLGLSLDRSVLNSFGKSFDGSGSSSLSFLDGALNGSGNGFGVGGHDDGFPEVGEAS